MGAATISFSQTFMNVSQKEGGDHIYRNRAVAYAGEGWRPFTLQLAQAVFPPRVSLGQAESSGAVPRGWPGTGSYLPAGRGRGKTQSLEMDCCSGSRDG